MRTKILTGTAKELETDTNELLIEGWELHGSLLSNQILKKIYSEQYIVLDRVETYTQMMVKYNETPK